MSLNVEKGKRKRIVIVGGGFGGLQVANGLKGTDYQVILIDKTTITSFTSYLSSGVSRDGSQFYFFSF